MQQKQSNNYFVWSRDKKNRKSEESTRRVDMRKMKITLKQESDRERWGGEGREKTSIFIDFPLACYLWFLLQVPSGAKIIKWNIYIQIYVFKQNYLNYWEGVLLLHGHRYEWTSFKCRFEERAKKTIEEEGKNVSRIR